VGNYKAGMDKRQIKTKTTSYNFTRWFFYEKAYSTYNSLCTDFSWCGVYIKPSCRGDGGNLRIPYKTRLCSAGNSFPCCVDNIVYLYGDRGGTCMAVTVGLPGKRVMPFCPSACGKLSVAGAVFCKRLVFYSLFMAIAAFGPCHLYDLYFFKAKPLAAYLQAPYIVWLVFAGVLNIWIALTN
jgi:hypothetical protein